MLISGGSPVADVYSVINSPNTFVTSEVLNSVKLPIIKATLLRLNPSLPSPPVLYNIHPT